MSVFLKESQIEAIVRVSSGRFHNEIPYYEAAVEFVRNQLRSVVPGSYKINNGRVLLFCDDAIETMQFFSEEERIEACNQVVEDLKNVFGSDVKVNIKFDYLSSEDRLPEIMIPDYGGELDTWCKYYLSVSIDAGRRKMW